MELKFLLERTQTLQHSTIKHEGTRRPKNSTQKKNIEQFKAKLDEYLSEIIDRPAGLTTNSLLSQKTKLATLR